MSATTATLAEMNADSLYMTANGVVSGCRGIEANLRDEHGTFVFQLAVVGGKLRAKALLGWLKERAAGRSFNELRADAFAWLKTNPRGKRTGFVAPT